MNLGKNIYNAFEVVKRTHENISKLIEYCKVIANEKGEYVLASPKFLRWKSDTTSNAWNVRSFILLFQCAMEKELENEWREGSIYVMEINLYEPEVFEEPMVTLARFDYRDIASWSAGCSPASHYIFYDPLYDLDYEEREDGIYIAQVEENYGDKHWGLESVECITVPLVEITGDNAYEKVFGCFDKLKCRV